VQPIVYTDTIRYNPAAAKAGGRIGAELLERSVKPPRLNSLGSRVLEQARDLFAADGSVLESLASPNAEPLRPFAYRGRASPGRGDALSTLFWR